MWLVGNEWNYNRLYSDRPMQEVVARVEEAAKRIQSLDGRPVATVYGELPDTVTLDALPSVDIWGINAYRGIGFDNLFTEWQSLSRKPMFISEYGADAYNDLIDAVDEDAQAKATQQLTQIIVANSVRNGGVAFGGTIFEWNDEWWKAGNPDVQDTGGIAPGGGPYPDKTFNEEYWGLVEIDRTPRPAYEALKSLYTSAR